MKGIFSISKRKSYRKQVLIISGIREDEMALEQRKHLRYDFVVKIEYISNPETFDDICKGFTINISNSGLCLFTTHCLNVGQEVSIKTMLPSSSQTAVVRWTRNFADASYHVGLEFTP